MSNYSEGWELYSIIEYAATGKEIREIFYNTKDSGGVKPTVVEYDENEKQIKKPEYNSDGSIYRWFTYAYSDNIVTSLIEETQYYRDNTIGYHTEYEYIYE